MHFAEFGVRRNGGFGLLEQILNPLLDGRLAFPRDAQHTRADDRESCAVPQRRQHIILHHALHLVRHARHDEDGAAAMLDVDAGGRAAVVRDDVRAARHQRLLIDCAGWDAAADLEEATDVVGDRLVVREVETESGGNGGDGEVVFGGSQAAGHQDDVGPRDRQPQSLLDARGVVADSLLKVDVDADLSQPLRQVGRVGVDDLAEEQLGTNGDDLCTHKS